MNDLQVDTHTLIMCLTEKFNNFKEGCIGNKIMAWSSLTTYAEILSTVSGLPLEFENRPSRP